MSGFKKALAHQRVANAFEIKQWLNGLTSRQHCHWVDCPSARNMDFKVQVWSSAVASTTHISNVLSLGDLLTSSNYDPTIVCIASHTPISMSNLNQVSIAA